MEYAALISFGLLILSWMALPASHERLLEEKAPVRRPQTAMAEA
jgi:hypothetical protein